MTASFNKQQFENRIYKAVTAEVNNVLKNIGYDQAEIVKAQRQILQALHFVAEETVTQITHGMLIMADADKRGK